MQTQTQTQTQPQTITTKTFHTQLNVRGDCKQQAFVRAVEGVVGLELPQTVNSACFDCKHGLQILCLGPDEWLLRSEQVQNNWQTTLHDTLANFNHSVVDVSHGLVCFVVQGARADEWLQRGCPLDLHPDTFAQGSLAQSHIAKANVSIVCVQAGLKYQVNVRSSFAGYLQNWLQAARDI